MGDVVLKKVEKAGTQLEGHWDESSQVGGEIFGRSRWPRAANPPHRPLPRNRKKNKRREPVVCIDSESVDGEQTDAGKKEMTGTHI